MTEHVTNALTDYLDDELPPGERASIDAHLRACPVCAGELDTLRRLVAYAGTVAADDVAPERELWSGIHARISAPIADAAVPARVASFADAARTRGEARRQVSLSIPQLAAAAVLLMAVSGTAAWMLRGGAPATTDGGSAIRAEIEASAPSTEARLANFADAQYDAAVSDLERALHERRNDLNPRTVEILERNLKLIDAAIAQARQALEDDPGNTYLNRHLVESRRRKLELLRRAAAITEGD